MSQSWSAILIELTQSLIREAQKRMEEVDEEEKEGEEETAKESENSSSSLIN